MRFAFPYFFRLVFTTILMWVATISYSQDDKVIDSLKSELKKAKTNTQKAQQHFKISSLLLAHDPALAREHASQGIKLAKNTKDSNLLNNLWNITGSSYYYEGDWNNCLAAYQNSLDFALKFNLESEMAMAYNNIGLTQMNLDNFLESQRNFLLALEIQEKEKNTIKEIGVLNNLTSLYINMQNLNKALTYANKSYEKAIAIKDSTRLAVAFNNLGSIYYEKDELEKALKFIMQAITIYENANETWSLSTGYANAAMIMAELKDFEGAEKYLLLSLKLKKQLGDEYGEAGTNVKLGAFYLAKNQLETGLEYYSKAEKYFTENKDGGSLSELYQSLAADYFSLKKGMEAYDYLLKYITIRDTLINESQSNAVEEMAVKYETSKKEKEILEQKHKVKMKNEALKVRDAELESEKYFKNFVIAGFAFAVIIAFVIARSLYNNKKKNKLITRQNLFIEEKNKSITDSINYAKRIQEAILPPSDSIKNDFADNFIFYQPKDVVSGDFYQIFHLKDEIIIVVADCTGHGVPGAFMSMIGNEQLHKIIIEKEITEPAKILTTLHHGIRKALKQDSTQTDNRDGMDIALYKINKLTNELQFAGANRPLWMIYNNDLTILKPDKRPIGGIQIDAHTEFTNHLLKLEIGSSIYTFSDGYADQFGGIAKNENVKSPAKGKKLLLKNLEKLILKINHLPMNEQKNILQKEFTEWKGSFEQIDDVCIIGIRV